jgi:hypothetical protein
VDATNRTWLGAHVNIKELLSNPISGSIIGIAGILISLSFAYLIYLLSSFRRKPVYTVWAPTLFADVSDNTQDLSLQWRGETIPNISSLNIAFWNNGRQAIRRQDISTDLPIELVSTEKVRIFSVTQVASSRAKLGFDYTIARQSDAGDYVQVRPANDEALERTDGAMCTILFSGNPKANWLVRGRVFDVPKGFKFKPTNNRETSFLTANWASIMSGAMASISFGLGSWNNPQWRLLSISLVALMIVSVITIESIRRSMPYWIRKSFSTMKWKPK